MLCVLILYISGGTYGLKSTPNDSFEKLFNQRRTYTSFNFIKTLRAVKKLCRVFKLESKHGQQTRQGKHSQSFGQHQHLQTKDCLSECGVHIYSNRMNLLFLSFLFFNSFLFGTLKLLLLLLFS